MPLTKNPIATSGVLLTKYCPDPALYESHEAWAAVSANAHYIWYTFAALGLVAAIALLVFARVTKQDNKPETAE